MTVRVRRVLRGDGKLSVERTVHCPEGNKTVSLEQCTRCGKALGLMNSAAFGCDIVDCQLAPAPVRGPSPPARGSTLDALRKLPVRQLMTGEVTCTERETPLDVARDTLVDERIGSLPVVEAEGRLCGVLSLLDALRPPFGATRVGDAMSCTPISVFEETPVVQAAAQMSFEGIHHLPVVDVEQRVIGMLSTIDILRWVGLEGGFLVPPRTARQREPDRG